MAAIHCSTTAATRGKLALKVESGYLGSADEVRAPFAGAVLYVIATPPITRGEPGAMIGALRWGFQIALSTEDLTP